MRLIKEILLPIFFGIGTITVPAQNQSPQVSNVTFSQRTDGSFIVDVNYDVNDPEGDAMNISMQVSSDNGSTWEFSCNNLTGDVGANITSGTLKHIGWDFGTEHSQTFGDQFKIKIIADDGEIEFILPTVTTSSITNITSITATGGGNVTAQGSSSVTARGVCWSTSQNPITTNDHTNDGTGIGIFTSSLTGLNPSTQYYVRAYATNSAGTSYGNQVSFTTFAETGTPPTVTTSSITNITSITATGGGNVTAQGSSSVTARGVCWSTSQNPITTNDHTNDGTGIGIFTSSLTGLNPSTQYYVRAYATNSAGTSYGNQVSFTTFEIGITGQPCPGIPYITDQRDGRQYVTVQIGEQCWLKKNLNVGTKIDGSLNQQSGNGLEKYCYDNLESNCDTYGGLYQWNEAMQYTTLTKAQGICPEGWHIPSIEELDVLLNFVAYDGNKLKDVSQGFLDGAGTNESGFSALLGGHRFDESQFLEIEMTTFIQSSSETDISSANVIFLNAFDSGVGIFAFPDDKASGFSVRCIMGGGSKILEPPTLSAPSHGQVDVNFPFTISWNFVTDATNYRLQVSTVNSFDSFVYNDTVGNVTNKEFCGLNSNTQYFWRVIASNMTETSEPSETWSFITSQKLVYGIPCNGLETITDNRDNRVYHTVMIGNQCWLQENINVGTISSIQSDNGVIEKFCYDNNDPNTCDNYGGMYQWDEALQYSTTTSQGICPTGWHIPSLAEYQTLISYVANDGNSLKDIGQGKPDGGCGTNTSGFSGLLSGFYSSGFGGFRGYRGMLWSTTELIIPNYINTAYTLGLIDGSSAIDTGAWGKGYALSVRCIKD